MAVCLALSVRHNEGRLVYALDDPYIHMAMARNAAEHGVWGVTRYGFTSSSSAPLWTALLSLVYLASGPGEVAPLVLNLVFAVGLCSLAHALLRRRGAPPLVSYATLALIVFASPLPAVIFCGQEHMLHALLTMSFAWAAVVALSQRGGGRAGLLSMVILAPLVTAARYEGLFAVLVVAILLAVQKRWGSGALVGAAGLAPVVGYGVLSVREGWSFVPNPVLLKGNTPDFGSVDSALNFVYQGYRQTWHSPHIAVLVVGGLVALLVLLSRGRRIWEPEAAMVVVFLGTTGLHMQLAGTGWFFRYEAYLVSLGLLALGLAATELLAGQGPAAKARGPGAPRALLVLLGLVLASPFVLRGFESFRMTPRASGSIYDQQYQMGLFLRARYEGKTVAANDIGAINYLADIRCVDLWGLANREAARARRAGRYGAKEAAEVARSQGAEIAIVYDEWFERAGGGKLDLWWEPVGQWRIPDRATTGGDTVSFYAVAPGERESLSASLRAFGPRLPGEVAQMGEYTEGE